MKLAVFGATGRTGRLLVARALERGHSVTAFARSTPAGGSLGPVDRVVTGDARNEAAVASALRDVEAAISAMGPNGPAPGSVYSEAIGSLVRSMRRAELRRLVISANSRVLDDDELEGPYAAVSLEHREALATLGASDLEWTVVSTPLLTETPPVSSYEVVVDARAPGGSIARGNFASALLDAVARADWIRHIVDVSDTD
ncbi:MAG TPA: NAD(P)H-binding protein [Actinomycetota bacterium]|nr:NAD(P)H-binding protein [Actinomycetota bacterium]